MCMCVCAHVRVYVYTLISEPARAFFNFCGVADELWQTSKACYGGCCCWYCYLLRLLLFETLYLDVASPAITFAVDLLLVVMHRSEVVAVTAGGLFALETARSAGSDGSGSSSSSGGGHRRECGGECQGGAGGGLGEHRE